MSGSNSKIDNKLMRNLTYLKSRALDVKFDLDGTDYIPKENIGIGAYGVVCSAIHQKSNDRVAIKKIPFVFDVKDVAKRTYREVKILKHFKHDNIIRIREILKPKEDMKDFKDIYVVFDLMESDLHRIIYSKQELSEEHVRYFLYQILRGLKYIHSANVIHRDLKPSNLLVNEDCQLRIGDFGKDYISQLKLIIGIVGSPAPELLNLCQSNMIKNYCTALGLKQAVPWSTLYPKASKKALSLLNKMLVLHPKERITVEQALVHPYLNKYHDPDDEPICVPAFNFDFEKKDMDKDELREAIYKEIMDYHTPKTPTFSFNAVLRPVAKTPDGSQPSHPNHPLTQALTEQSSVNTESKGQVTHNDAGSIKKTAHHDQSEKDEVFNRPLSAKGDDSNVRIDTSPNVLSIDPNDVEMLSAKSLERKDDTAQDKILLKENREPEIIQASKPESNKNKSDQNKTISQDTKAIIKAALLKASQEKERRSSLSEENKPRPVTAAARQREREEKRRQKKEKHLERLKKQKERKGSENEGLLLTNADKEMLQRWMIMQKTNAPVKIAPKPAIASYPIFHPNATVSISNPPGNNVVDQKGPSQTHGQVIVGQNWNVPTSYQNQSMPNPSVQCEGQNTSQGHFQGHGQFHHTQIQSSHQSDRFQQVSVPKLPSITVTQMRSIQDTNNLEYSHNVNQAAGQSFGQEQSGTNLHLKDQSFGDEQFHVDFSTVNLQNVNFTSVGDFTTCHDRNTDRVTMSTVHNSSQSNSYISSTVASTDNNEDFLQQLCSHTSPQSYHQVSPASEEHVSPQSHHQLSPAHNRFPVHGGSPSYLGEHSDSSLNSTFNTSDSMHSDINGSRFFSSVYQSPRTDSQDPHSSSNSNSNSPPLTINTKQESVQTALRQTFTQPQPGPSQPIQDDLLAQGGSPHDLIALLSQQLSRSNVMDDFPPSLTLTPRGTGGGYGVGLDLDNIMLDAQDQQEMYGNNPEPSPLSSSILADWMEVTSHLNIDLEALEQELQSPMALSYNDLNMYSA
ncbi:hypothetical protein CHS0354_034724 [Potamilus streckersoni]|uniref:Mitogen-activated protein kinase n=1 Tax=Potamilus streckersoni TaxID=2493646 RepID=A0AAE0SJ39_9BIVA|nr:hypothetical protein CHS0354_034724 [Potamilus streckersoni]